MGGWWWGRLRAAPWSLATLVVALGCGHSEPFATVPPPLLGSPTAGLPRRLTYNTRADRMPSVAGDTIVFSRVDEKRPDGDQCLAFLPIEGGTLYRTQCAREGLADSVRDSWLYPAVSPDGKRVAFVRERVLYRAGSLLERVLVVGPLATPDSAVPVTTGYDLPTGERGTGFRDVTWKDGQTLRFLGGIETSGGGSVVGFRGEGVFEVALSGNGAGVVTLVPGTAGAAGYTPGDDGAVYFHSRGSGVVSRLVGEGQSQVVAQFTGDADARLVGLTDLVVSADLLTVIGRFEYPEFDTVARLLVADLATGGPPAWIETPVPAERLGRVPGQARVIMESGGDLWLVPLR